MSTNSDDARRRRLAEVWRASAPSRDEIVHLRARLERSTRRPRTSRRKVIIVALVQGLFFGAATLAAAAWIAGKAAPRAPLVAVAPPAASRAPAAQVRGAALVAKPMLPPSAPTAAFDDVDDGATRVEGDVLRTEGGGRARPTGAHAQTGKLSPPTPVFEQTPPTATAEAPGVVVAPSANGPWARVAQALSEKDWSGADRALNDLSSNGDPTTRDAADLTRAELSIARGEAGRLRPLVERLARSGATGLIRKRAAALLDRLPSR